ncbi:MAB_1171c family putative transporter [Streptomyces sp. ADMS]|uniref:MAB_1171c family putative transporter n=1 Tax=Streptomyces sp. ADMS TaxID=3071415 RepID=UPI00296F5C5B|nr:MAB_1171c family putative transporter [Streptomyces sp. ADMS]MDW4910900.1 MAB_1171c family putative transporter [Streptomyces sp. ADMS]
MNDSSYYVPSAAMVIVLLLKGRTVLRAWRDPLQRSVYALLLLSVLVFLFAAPPTIAWVNRVTSVPNISAPLVYCLLSAFSASCLVLIINWRGGPPEATRRASRRWIAGYAVVIVATAALFVLGDAPEQRLRDFDTHYANTPFIREMIVLYLVALTVANIAMNMMCWPWALQVHGWLRVGLLVIVAGFFCNIAFAAAKLTAVAARWNGGNLDHLSTYVAPAMAAAAEIVTAAGFCIPLAFQRVEDVWSTWSTYRRLSPLWRELAPLSDHGDRTVRIAWWSPAELQVTQRESDIHDGMLSLYPYFDPDVRTRAYDAARTAGSSPDAARAEADAAMVTAALRARAADPEGRVISTAAESAGPPSAAEGPRDLVGMSLALRRSPVVAEIREGRGF